MTALPSLLVAVLDDASEGTVRCQGTRPNK